MVPKHIRTLLADREARAVAMRELLKEAEKDNRGLSEAEVTKFTLLEKEFDGITERINLEERMSRKETFLAGLESEPEFESDEGREERSGFEKPEAPVAPGKKGGFATLGEQLRAVAQASIPGGRIDPRLLRESRSASGLSETVPSEGGFLVEQDFVDGLLDRAFETGILPSKCTTIPIGAKSNGVRLRVVDETSRVDGSRFGGINLYWTGEAEKKTASKPKLRQMDLRLDKLTGMFYATDELLEDTTALESWVSNMFGKEFGYKLDDAILNGTGAGMPLGVYNSPALITIAKEGSQAANTVLIQNIVKMYDSMYSGSVNNAVWVYGTGVFPVIALMKFDPAATQPVPIFLPGNIQAGYQPTILGRPMNKLEQAPALSAAGDLGFFDFSEYMLIRKGGIKTDVSIHVRFEYDETAFRFVLRINGQPIWNTALTPAKGSITTSPFVALGAR